MRQLKTVSGTLVDIPNRNMFGARIDVSEQGDIESITADSNPEPGFILPGFVDAHVHVESSMLGPVAFAREAVRHGTLGVVQDPHEIANVLGIKGVDFMLAEAARTPLFFATGAPSCVPATPFETAGAELDHNDITQLLARNEVTHLSEMMNVPGVLNRESGVMAKLEAARQHGKPVDGHAPGLRGADLSTYVQAGISTDHECLDLDEALEKAAAGLSIQLRYGSAARIFTPLLPLIDRFPQSCMFCSDDKHPDDLMRGHIDEMVRIAVQEGIDIFHVLQAACVNPVLHYSLPLGLLREGDRADWIEVEDLQTFHVKRSVLKGKVVAEKGVSVLPMEEPLDQPNQFLLQPITSGSLRVPAKQGACRLITVTDGDLITGSVTCFPTIVDGTVVADASRDILKLVVCNRYAEYPEPAVAMVSGIGLQRGAFAASIAHDSHHLVAVGCDDTALERAINMVIGSKGGLAAVDGQGREELMPLPVAGLMTTMNCEQAAESYIRLNALVRACGCPLHAPFMTLSFLSLPVIPNLKLTDQGLFDGIQFRRVGFWV
ncbi:adenine deaminase [Desulfogranum japonicum]|uniref:adenine deaminase n=1 Tax=Desulfogranum japonicum TaxID=231447 RepID=UPI0004143681|nr:adenine deaminase [Desulfogranum japonicum]